MDDNVITIKFDGDYNIDVDILCSLTKCLKRVNSIIDNNTIQLTAMNKGSVILDFICNNASFIADVVAIFTGILELRKFLKGKDIYKIDKSNVTNYYGETINVDNRVINLYCNNASVEKEFSELSRIISNEPNKGTFSIITNNGKQVFVYSKGDMENTQKKITRQYKNGNIVFNDYIVNFLSFDLTLKNKWKYRALNSNSIDSAKMIADEFIEQIQEGITISSNSKYGITVKTIKTDSYSKKEIIECHLIE